MATTITKTSYTVPEVPGSKRTSARPYTHAIVGRANVAARRQKAQAEGERKQLAKNWNWHAKESTMKAGDLIHVTNTYRPWSYPITQERIDEHLEVLAKYPTEEAFVQGHIDAHLKRIHDEFGDADEGPLEVLQWSMSAANAQKGLSSWKYKLRVRIVECVPVVKPARKSKRVESSPHEANNI